MAFKPLEHKILDPSFIYILCVVHPFTQTTECTLTSKNSASAVISLCGTTGSSIFRVIRIVSSIALAQVQTSVDARTFTCFPAASKSLLSSVTGTSSLSIAAER